MFNTFRTVSAFILAFGTISCASTQSSGELAYNEQWQDWRWVARDCAEAATYPIHPACAPFTAADAAPVEKLAPMAEAKPVAASRAEEMPVERASPRIAISVPFVSGSTAVDGSEALLDNIAVLMRDYPLHKLVVRGHADSTGDRKLNRELSQRRAEGVASYLQERGIARDRISTEGLGDSQPIAGNSTEEGRAANRRVEFQVVSANSATASN